jgi:hypothetical protein
MNTPRPQIAPSYDSAQTGPRYWITSRVNNRTVVFREPLQDPFVAHRVSISNRGLLRALATGRLDVTVIIGADADMVEDVLELDAQYNRRVGPPPWFYEHVTGHFTGAFHDHDGNPAQGSVTFVPPHYPGASPDPITVALDEDGRFTMVLAGVHFHDPGVRLPQDAG